MLSYLTVSAGATNMVRLFSRGAPLTRSAAIVVLGYFPIVMLAQTLPAPLSVYDGFEAPTLSEIWETPALAPGAAVVQSSIARSGNNALRITLKPRDLYEAGGTDFSASERDEILEARRLVSRENVPYEFSWSMYLPKDFPIAPVRLVVAQWKQYCSGGAAAPCSDDSPVLAVRYIGGVVLITQDIDHEHHILYQERRDLRGSWLDLRVRVRFTSQNSGHIQTWLNGKQVIDYRGVTANSESAKTGYHSSGHFYFKMGLYRNVMTEPMTIYLDEYRKRELPEDRSF